VISFFFAFFKGTSRSRSPCVIKTVLPASPKLRACQEDISTCSTGHCHFAVTGDWFFACNTARWRYTVEHESSKICHFFGCCRRSAWQWSRSAKSIRGLAARAHEARMPEFPHQ
jgi:hypothetical protein